MLDLAPSSETTDSSANGLTPTASSEGIRLRRSGVSAVSLASKATAAESVSSQEDVSSGARKAEEKEVVLTSEHLRFSRRLRPSRLDLLSPDSTINMSEFRGFLNLMYSLCYLYLAANPVYRYYETGHFFDHSMARAMFSDFFLLMFTWGCVMCWSFSSYCLFKAFLKYKFHSHILHAIQFFLEVSLISASIGLVLAHEWAVFPSIFVCVIGAIYSMKMHSYTQSTLEFFKKGPPSDLPEDVEFPKCCTFRHYVTYLVRPVLVYEIAWPRSKGPFRPTYFIAKVTHMLASLFALYLLLTSSVIPVVLESFRHTFVHTVAKLVGPLILVDLLLFFFMFECVCNALAELTGHGDRDFYGDWWNSSNFDEFSRKWNKPVHEFLLRHVYWESHSKLKMNKIGAAAFTFVFSAVIHELILAVSLRMIRFYMFWMMLTQIPLITIGTYFKQYKRIGNLFFWGGILLGVPVLETIYARDWSAIKAHGSSKIEFPPIF